MSDAQRGNTTHGPEMDEELERETRGMVQGHASAPHAEPFRESEPLPDDTDDPEAEQAFRHDAPRGAEHPDDPIADAQTDAEGDADDEEDDTDA
ncbi:hypothetical protein [Microbacterium sp. NPDC096154]|uniref:hypothetical protein n=1 Tax=Microbacterium sp. NPDC096154 TaxID=3155549 RepID=UPI0033297F49